MRQEQKSNMGLLFGAAGVPGGLKGELCHAVAHLQGQDHAGSLAEEKGREACAGWPSDLVEVKC